MFSPVTRLALLMALCVVLFGSGTTAAGRQRAPEPSWADPPRWLVWALSMQNASTSSGGEQKLAASFRAPCEMTIVQTNDDLGGQRSQLKLILDLRDIDPSKLSVKASPEGAVVTLQVLPEREFLMTRSHATGCAGSRCAWGPEVVSKEDRHYDVVLTTGADVKQLARHVAYAFHYASLMCGKRSDTPPPMA